MYEYIEPVDMKCEITGSKSEKYKRIGLWKSEEDAENGNDPDRVLSINFFLERINNDDVKFYEQHAFEGDIIEINADHDSVVITVENVYCTMVHEFDVRNVKKEQFVPGNPNTASPGSKVHHVDELDGDMADVEIIEPNIEPRVFENKSDYYKHNAEEHLE